MRTETATRILDAIAAGKIHSLADSDAVGMQRRYLSVCLQELRGMGVEIRTNAGWGPGHVLKPWTVRKWGPFARRRK